LGIRRCRAGSFSTLREEITVQLLVLGATVAFVIVGGLVGVRLLLLARRTRQLPELLMGLVLFTTAGVGWPLLLIARIPGLLPDAVQVAAYCGGRGLINFGLSALFVFTWKVFRPDDAWAKLLAVSGIASFALQFAVTVHAAIWGGATAGVPEFGQHWMLFEQSVVGVSFAWTGIESFRYHGMLRRRLALGLADPVVANRFLLWGLSSISSVTMNLVGMGFLLAGVPASSHPLNLATTGICGVVSCVCLYLAFLPPAFHLRRIRRAASASEA
jgi:hypothetical protein